MARSKCSLSLLGLILLLSFSTVNADQIVDSFDDGVLDPSKWVGFSFKGGTGGVGVGSAVATVTEVALPSGFVEGRVTTPTSANTFGGWASLRSGHNFNDGLAWQVDFEWQAFDDSPSPRHANFHLIQITDGVYSEGVIPLFANGWWNPGFSTAEEGSPNPSVANILPDGTHNLYSTNDVQVGPMSYSMLINPNTASATLYDGSNLTGSVIGTTLLNLADPWHIRWATVTGTSAGFPSKDIGFRVLDFEAATIPEPSSFALLTIGTTVLCGWRRKQKQSFR